MNKQKLNLTYLDLGPGRGKVDLDLGDDLDPADQGW